MIDRKTRAFIWDNQRAGRGLHSVGWNVITKPKVMGGLAEQEARHINTSLLGNLLWSLADEQEKYWVQLLCSRYLKGKSLFSVSVPCNSSYIWRGIVKTVQALREGFRFNLDSGHFINLV